MASIEKLTVNDVRNYVGERNYKKGRSYRSRVQDPARRGNTLTAKVQGTRLYELEIEIDPEAIFSTCSCPYNQSGSLCKHICALLLKWAESPREFTVHASDGEGRPNPLPVTPVDLPQSKPPDKPPHWMAASFTERQAEDDRALAAYLHEHTLQTLRTLVKTRGWAIKGALKDGFVSEVMTQMTSMAGNAKAIYTLDEAQRNILRAAALLDAPVPSRVSRIAMTWGTVESEGQVSKLGAALSAQGLAIPGHVIQSYPPRMDFIPRGLMRHFPPLLEAVVPSNQTLQLKSPTQGATQGIAQPSADVHVGDAQTFVRTVNQVMLLLEQSSPPLRPPMPRPALEKFVPHLKGWDYDPDELAAMKAKLRTSQGVDLTVPPPARLLPDDALARLAPIAGGEVSFEFILALLTAMNVVQPGSPVALWPDGKQAFLRHTEAEQRALLARTYFGLENWSELWEIIREQPDLQIKRTVRAMGFYSESSNPINSQLMGIRQLILRTLSQLPDNRWVLIDDLRPLLRALWSRFDQGGIAITHRPYNERGGWYLSRHGAPLDTENGIDWMIGQWRFIRFMLTGPLHWLGLVDIGTHNETPVAIRLRGLADLYWERVDAPPFSAETVGRAGTADLATTGHQAVDAPPNQPSSAVVVEEQTIRVNPSSISAQAHGLLDKIARLDDASVGSFVYQLDKQAVHQAFEDGLSLADLETEWQTHIQQPLPEPLQRQLTAWWESYGQARIYEDVTIIEFADDYALTEMKAVTALETVMIAEISPRLVLIPKTAVATLTAALEKAGYTPKVAG